MCSIMLAFIKQMVFIVYKVLNMLLYIECMCLNLIINTIN
ncbi:MAG: hypothetical protein ACI8WT_005018, partial [Clostridium sp.]